MKTPFPGMDPYLEHRALWPDVYTHLIATLADTLTSLIAPDYDVKVESRTYIGEQNNTQHARRPGKHALAPVGSLPLPTTFQSSATTVMEIDVLIGEKFSQRYLAIYNTRTDELITAIELLSPDHKSDPQEQAAYLSRRERWVLASTNFVEIDLLRAGEPMPIRQTVESDYRILVNRGWKRNKASLYAFNLPAAIPAFPLPLQRHEAEPLIPLNDVVHDLYSRARFDLRIDYSELPPPPLTEEQVRWVRNILTA